MPELLDFTAQRHEDLPSAVAGERFPCVGAKSALARGLLKTVECGSLEGAGDDPRIHAELLEWVSLYRSEPGGLRSLAIMFEGPVDLCEQAFEMAMWRRLQSLADQDHARGQPYDPGVSSNPDDPQFALSFGGAAFFVVGLHPNASRPARRVRRPTLVFNLHDQFEQLREGGVYERMRETIISRDVAFAGNVNPMLARFGDSSGARQYSGRAVGEEWRCPFRDPRTA